MPHFQKRGNRIRDSDKSLVFRFSAGSLLLLFLAYGNEAYNICGFSVHELKLYNGQKEYFLPKAVIQHTKLQINPIC